MTREEAIDYLTILGGIEGITANEAMALEIAIEALEQEPTTKNDLGVDCISRDSAIKALDYDIKYFEFKSGVSKYMDDIAKLLNTIYETQVNNIKALPSVTPIRPKGHWIYDKSIANWICSKCGETPKTIGYVGTSAFMAEHFKYCNHCGAEMEGSDEV